MGSFFTSHVVSRKIVTMRLCFALVATLVACSGDDSMLPVGGGGNDGGFGSPDGGGGTTDGRIIDAPTGTPSPIDASLFVGRVCLLSDSRKIDQCASTGAGGLTVRLGSSTAVTSDSGMFTIAGTAATVWTVTGANIVTSLKVVGDYEIPAITRTMFNGMIAQNLMPFPPNAGEGHVIAQVVRNGMPLPGATATQPAAATWAPFYDGSDATHWTQAGTGANGAVWIPNIDVGAASTTFASGTTTIMSTGIPIQDGAITFMTVIFP
jgi:hypothetical protein